MTCIIDNKSKRRLSAKLAAALALSAVLVLGTLVASASAQDRRGDERRGGDNRGYVRNPSWGSYYVAPPLVYGPTYYAPYYAPPPVVYGPGVGIFLPGVNINIR